MTGATGGLATARFCPNCKADLQGAPIPEADQEAYGGNTHFHRAIGLYSRELDRTVAWQCPDCDYKEARA
ncbi:MAG TPA: hypothetical protein VNL97_07520 [Solirubrobacterales bacterium]|nr:hypothetical protein [Solirubrobacterales bacterium]